MQDMSYTTEIKPRHVLVVELGGEDSTALRARALRQIVDALDKGEKNGTFVTDAVTGTWATRRAWKL